MKLLRTAVLLLLMLSVLGGCRSIQNAFVGAVINAAVKVVIGAPLISIEHTDAWSNRRVSLTVGLDNNLTLTTQTGKSDPVTTKRRISYDEYSKLQRVVSSVDWQMVAQDRVLGKDGSMVRFNRGGYKVSLWSPELDTRKRGLRKVVKLMNTAFHLAGLDADSLPQNNVSSLPHSFPVPGSSALGLPPS